MARIAAIAPAFLLGGCLFWRSEPAAPPDPKLEYLAQSPVRALPETGKPGLVELPFERADFAAGTLKMPAGEWTFNVRNVDQDGQIGFFLRQPDKYGRESENHLATGGGIRRGQVRAFTVTLAPNSVYFYNEPLSGSPTHQLYVGEALAVPLPPPTPTAEVDALAADPFALEEPLVPTATDDPPLTEAEPSEPNLEGLDAGEVMTAPPASATEEATDAAESEEPIEGQPTPVPSPAEPAPEEEDVLSPRVRELLDALDRADKRAVEEKKQE